MVLFAGCKINIGLEIISKRDDGFHNIETLMLPVDGLCDSIEILHNDGDGVLFSASGLAVDCPVDKNLCLKAYNLMRERYGISGVRLHLHKAVPFGAGLGGGSSDAAYVIKGLNTLFELGLDVGHMEALSAELGSDTAFFISNRSAICSGRGEVLTPFYVDQLRGKHLLIVKPNVDISTAQAYSGVKTHLPSVPLAERLSLGIDSWRANVGNAFESSIFSAHPVLARIKQEIYDCGASYASMSGSGASLFGFFDFKPDVTRWDSNVFVYQQVVA